MAENYKALYEQMNKLVAKYQDEIVPGLREQMEIRVEVVRCHQCIHHSQGGLPDDRVWCRKMCRYMDADEFCSRGERREGE